MVLQVHVHFIEFVDPASILMLSTIYTYMFLHLQKMTLGNVIICTGFQVRLLSKSETLNSLCAPRLEFLLIIWLNAFTRRHL